MVNVGYRKFIVFIVNCRCCFKSGFYSGEVQFIDRHFYVMTKINGINFYHARSRDKFDEAAIRDCGNGWSNLLQYTAARSRRSRCYIEKSRFEIDMNFCDKIPPRILSGMTLRLRIELGKSSDELLLPVGGFYKDTGGKWIYVVRDGFAVRRNIKLGRKAGAEYFEVLDGLKAGDEVITSSYENFDQADVLDIAELEKRIHL